MKTENKAAEVSARIEKLLNDKAQELATIKAELSEAQERRSNAAADMQKAMEATDIKAYERAKLAKQAEESAIEMYSARYKQLEEKEFMTEAESDKVINSILDYEKQLDAEFMKLIARPADKIRDLLAEYRARINEAEHTISNWTHSIHANYISKTTTYADGSNRSPRPQPVRVFSYDGCALAHNAKKFLEAEERSRNEINN